MAGLLFNGTGYVSFPKDNRLILNQTDGWTLLVKMKYGTNAGDKVESVFVGQSDGSLINYVETFVGQDLQSSTWNRNRFVCHLRTAGGTAETIESPNLTFPDADYAIYFVRKQGNTLAVGRCSAGGSVVKTTKTNSQLFDIPLQEFFLGYAGSRTTSAHVPLGSGREVKEFGLVSRLVNDTDIQNYANGTSFTTIAGADLFGFAALDEGAGSTVDLDIGVTPVVGTISGGLTWIGGASGFDISKSELTVAGKTLLIENGINLDLNKSELTVSGKTLSLVLDDGFNENLIKSELSVSGKNLQIVTTEGATISVLAIRNNPGSPVWANTGGWTVTVTSLSDDSIVYRDTNTTISVDSEIILTEVEFISGTFYQVVVKKLLEGSWQYGIEIIQAV